MKYLQKVTKTLKEGKVEKEDKGEIKAVVDSVADNLVIDGEQAVKAKVNGIVTVYEEVKKADKVAQDKKSGKVKEEVKKAPAKQSK